MTEYMDIINGKKGIYAEARKKWKPTKGVLYPSLNKKKV
jgi:hypothetical protein